MARTKPTAIESTGGKGPFPSFLASLLSPTSCLTNVAQPKLT